MNSVFLESFKHWVKTSHRVSPQGSKALQLAQDLEKLVCEYDHPLNPDHELLYDPTFQSRSIHSRGWYSDFETFLEMVHSRKLSRDLSEIENTPLNPFLFALEEVKKSKIDEESSVLMLGSGPLPETLIAFHSLTGCKCTCLDKSKVHLDLSKKVVQELGFCDHFSFVHAEGEHCFTHGFNLIIVAALAINKEAILSNLSHHLSPDQKILVRGGEGLRTSIYEPVSFSEKDWNVHSYIPGKKDVVMSSWILLPKRKPL